MPTTREGDSVIVEGTVEHGIYPVHHEEIEQTVILQGDYTVYGGIYGKRLQTSGFGVVHGPVVTREDLMLDQRHLVGKQCHEFRSGLTSSAVLRNEVPAYQIDESVVVDLANARLRIRGPILADTVQLSNALIVGNIHARQVTLESCVVFGVIECEELLVLNSCNFVAYQAGRARLMGRCTTWLGYGISYDGIDFLAAEVQREHIEPGKDSQGASSPADLRFLPVCMSGAVCDKEDDFETCNLYHDGRCPVAASGSGVIPKVSMTDLDFQLLLVARSDKDLVVEARGEHGGEPVPRRIRLSRLVEMRGREAVESLEIRTKDSDWMPFEEHPAFDDYDPVVTVRCDHDEFRSGKRVRLSALQSLLANGASPSTLFILDEGGGAKVFHKHSVFRDRWRVARIMSVTGRILDGRSVRDALKSIKTLGHRIAHYPYLDPNDQKRVHEEQPRLRGTGELFEFGISESDVRRA